MRGGRAALKRRPQPAYEWIMGRRMSERPRFCVPTAATPTRALDERAIVEDRSAR
ncbi:hypothetical protein HY573_01210 [Candidatus Parcubacteria bacterium]|nr:hypothetical protein [Candidatus Parcubacteria bacterium]